jgi:hypothetical protein
MRTDNDLLGEPRGVAAHNYIRGTHGRNVTLVSTWRQFVRFSLAVLAGRRFGVDPGPHDSHNAEEARVLVAVLRGPALNPKLPMKIELQFKEAGQALAESLSAMIKIGDSIFAGGDEGVKLARLEERDGGKRYEQEQMIDLSKWFDLPRPPSDDPATKVKEIDLEGMDAGMDADGKRAVLWLIGSHSHKRGKAAPGETVADNLKKLGKVEPDDNRQLLGYLPLGGDEGKPRIAVDGPKLGEARAGQLRADATTSDLLTALAADPLFARFCGAGSAIPGKDNGVDIEGLACAPGGRLLVGLRGPVFRGIAVVIEVQPVRVEPPGAHADLLTLAPIGPDGRLYRRHFLDLAGHGVRDLCWDGGDLLILAGPTMSLDAPPQIFRWQKAKDALGKNTGDDEAFVWRKEGVISPEKLDLKFEQTEIGKDHAETITFLRKKELAIGYDAPSKAYLVGLTLKADVVAI